MNDIFFSVITVTYNCKDTLEKAIQSVLNQKYPFFEYIIIDGNSNDGTVDIIKRYASYLSYFVSENDNGIYNAMNKALEKINGNVVCFLGGDDYYTSNEVLEKIAKGFMNSDADIIAARSDYGNDISEKVQRKVLDRLYVQMSLNHQSVFAKKKIFDDIGKFDENFKYAADYKWLLNAYGKGYKFLGIDDIVVFYNTKGMSSNYDCIHEMKTIAMDYSLYGKSQLSLNEIEKEYEKIIKFWNFAKCIDEPEHINYYDCLVKLFSGRRKSRIWGCGYWGKKIVRFLQDNNIQISKIIDRDASKRDYLGIPVDQKIIINNDEVLIIGSAAHNYEIKKILIDNGYSEGKEFISFFNFIEACITYRKMSL